MIPVTSAAKMKIIEMEFAMKTMNNTKWFPLKMQYKI
jgi:hypothetical protein